MGLSLSVILANSYMEYLETEALKTAKLKPRLWRRFVDDVLLIWQHGLDTLPEFHNHINSLSESIKFTVEKEQEGAMNFLDMRIAKESGRLKISVFRKETASNLYIGYDSHHASSIKAGVISCLGARARSVTTDEVSLKNEMMTLKKIFQENGYPDKFIDKALTRKPRQKPGEEGAELNNQQSQQEEESATTRAAAGVATSPSTTGATQEQQEAPLQRNFEYVSLPYTKGVSERISRALSSHGVRVAHSSKTTLKTMLSRVKDPLVKEEKRGVVYEIKCECGSKYIGESGRPLGVRVEEHIGDIRNGRFSKSAVSCHVYSCRKDLNPRDIKILAVEPKVGRRSVREAIEIRLRDADINRDRGNIIISPIWDTVLESL